MVPLVFQKCHKQLHRGPRCYGLRLASPFQLPGLPWLAALPALERQKLTLI